MINHSRFLQIPHSKLDFKIILYIWLKVLPNDTNATSVCRKRIKKWDLFISYVLCPIPDLECNNQPKFDYFDDE